MSRGVLALAILPAFAVGCAGCASLGVVDDGTSVSYGPSNAGILLNPARLPEAGQGFVVPERWARRGLLYGTDEIVALIAHLGREVEAAAPGLPLGVGDLSPRRGGPSAWHRSHQTGRDVDLIFYTVDEGGRPLPPESMLRFDAEGQVVRLAEPAPGETPPPIVRFDLERNWLLVKAMAMNPIAEVQWIFIADWLRVLLLDHARARGEPEHVIEAAAYLMAQPGDSLPHDDHMHVRVFCAPTDRSIGCDDRGEFRWLKRDAKYAHRPPVREHQEPLLAALAGQPMPVLLALSALPFPGFVPR